MNTFKEIQRLAILEGKSIENILPHFVRVTDIDDSPDLTDIHPRDRDDLHLFVLKVDETLFPETYKLIKTVPEIVDAAIIGFAPNSQLYTHVDTATLPPYSDVNWVSVFMGMFVPSTDIEEVAVKIDNTIFNHKEPIIFDAQIPHSAWNKTSGWWISIRLSVLKKYF